MNKKLISLLITASLTASYAVAFAEVDLAKDNTIASQTQTEEVATEKQEPTNGDYMAENSQKAEPQEPTMAEKTVLAKEDFSSGMADWKVLTGSGYSIKNGALQFKNKRINQQTSLIMSKKITVSNADIEFDVKYKSGIFFGIVFRADSDQSMYALRFYKQLGKATLLKKVKGGDFVQVKSVDARISSDEFSRVGIRLAGRKIAIRIDGINIMTHEDASLAEGAIGFDAYQAEALVDNIEVFRFEGVEYDIEYPAEPVAKKTIYVAAQGDNGDGSYERPIVGIEKARDAARQAKRGGFAVDVIFKEGVYRINKTIDFTNQDSGLPGAPITYKAEEGADVEFTGAKTIKASRFKPVTDPEITRRLHNNAKGKVYQMSYSDEEIPLSIADVKPSTHVVLEIVYPSIYINNKLQGLARWPNGNYATIEDSTPGKDATKTGDTESPGAIHFTNTEPSRWLEAVAEGHVAVEGQLGVFWAAETIPIDRIDMQENKIWLKYSTMYTVQKDHRYYVSNLIEEMDIPGEFYIDPERKILYMYPSEELNEDTTIEIATLETPMLKFTGTQYINIEGLHITKTDFGDSTVQSSTVSGTGILLTDIRYFNIRNCLIDHIGYDGIQMISGIGLTVENCVVNDTGFSGIYIQNAGDRPTLTPSEVVIKNNIVSAPMRLTGGSGQSAIGTACEGSVGTVEMQVINNIIHNTRALAMNYYGNGNLIAHNEFSSCVNASADAGCIYVGRSFVDYGNLVYQNYFHDFGIIGSKSGHPAMGIYWDDEIPGQQAIQNIIVANKYQNIANVHISGTDHIFTGNTMVNSDRGFIYSQRKATPYDYQKYADNHYWKWTWAVPVTDPVFQEKYPRMATFLDRLMNDWGGFMRLESVVDNNLGVNIGKDSVHENAKTYSTMKDNVYLYYDGEPDESINYEIFVDPDNHDWRVKDEAREKYGIADEVLGEEFDMNTIGIQSGLTIPEGSDQFKLTFPPDKHTGIQTKDVTFSWLRADQADTYVLQVAEDPEFENIVYEEELVYTATYPSQLENSKTYYWRVTAKNISKQIGFETTSETWSFTTAAQDTLDYSLLDSKIDLAKETIRTMKESNKMDEYMPGTTDKVKAALKKAEDFRKTGVGTQTDVEAATEELNAFLLGLETYINAGYITLDFEEAEIFEAMGSGELTTEDNVVKYVPSANARGSLVYDKVLSNSSVLKFKARVDTFNDTFISFGLRTENFNTYTYGQDCYYMIIYKDKIELQRNGVIYRTVPNDYFKEGEWVDQEFAVITTAVGAHVFWKVGDQIVFDYLETASPKINPGNFMAYVPTGVTLELAPTEDLPTGLFERSEEIETALKEGTVTFDVFDTRFTKPSGTWQQHPTLRGKNGEYVMTSTEAGATADWNVIGDRKHAGKESFKVSYYHIPTPNGDKNVKVKLSNYFGSYETTIDLSKGEEGWVDIGGMKLISASSTSEGNISFTGSGNGEVNVSRVRIQYVEGEKDLIGK